MMRKGMLSAALAAALALGGVGAARAWEATTTNAGLTEAAALGSALHTRLQDAWGLELGLYAPLTVAQLVLRDSAYLTLGTPARDCFTNSRVLGPTGRVAGEQFPPPLAVRFVTTRIRTVSS